MKTRKTDIKLLRPELTVEITECEPPFVRIREGQGIVVELWENDLKQMLGELLGIPLKLEIEVKEVKATPEEAARMTKRLSGQLQE